MTKRKSLFANFLVPFENKWVALSRDNKTVFAAAVSLEALVKKLSRCKTKEVVFMKVPPFDQVLSP
jgi:hypothetical protein